MFCKSNKLEIANSLRGRKATSCAQVSIRSLEWLYKCEQFLKTKNATKNEEINS